MRIHKCDNCEKKLMKFLELKSHEEGYTFSRGHFCNFVCLLKYTASLMCANHGEEKARKFFDEGIGKVKVTKAEESVDDLSYEKPILKKELDLEFCRELKTAQRRLAQLHYKIRKRHVTYDSDIFFEVERINQDLLYLLEDLMSIWDHEKARKFFDEGIEKAKAKNL